MDAVGTTEASPTKIRIPMTMAASMITRRVENRQGHRMPVLQFESVFAFGPSAATTEGMSSVLAMAASTTSDSLVAVFPARAVRSQRSSESI